MPIPKLGCLKQVVVSYFSDGNIYENRPPHFVPNTEITMFLAGQQPLFSRAKDYLYNLEAMTSKDAKRLWRKSIRDAWNNQCAYCGKTPIDEKSLTLDHVRPKSKGGEDRTTNCVPACKDCNHSKGSTEWKEWFRQQEFYRLDSEARIAYWLETGVATLDPKPGFLNSPEQRTY